MQKRQLDEDVKGVKKKQKIVEAGLPADFFASNKNRGPQVDEDEWARFQDEIKATEEVSNGTDERGTRANGEGEEGVTRFEAELQAQEVLHQRIGRIKNRMKERPQKEPAGEDRQSEEDEDKNNTEAESEESEFDSEDDESWLRSHS